MNWGLLVIERVDILPISLCYTTLQTYSTVYFPWILSRGVFHRQGVYSKKKKGRHIYELCRD